MKIRLVFFAVLISTAGCPSPTEPRPDIPAQHVAVSSPDAGSAAAGARTPAVPSGSPHYDLFEGTSYKNDCAEDSDCKVGGCSHEVCSAQFGVEDVLHCPR